MWATFKVHKVYTTNDCLLTSVEASTCEKQQQATKTNH